MTDVLTLRNVSKRFGSREVLRGLNLSVPEHSIFGFIGRNGAGKTTTMKAILGLIKIDDGDIDVLGQRVRFGQSGTNQHIGYLPDVPEFYPFLTPREYLTLCGRISGMSAADIKARSEELLHVVGLGEERRRIKGFSRGMKQRLGIAQALLNRPRLLICDEPTSALDPAGRKDILDILLAAKQQTTVLFSTHILSDVERICTDVAFLDGGNVVMQGTVAQLRSQRAPDEFVVETLKHTDAEFLMQRFENCRLESQNTLVFEGGQQQYVAVLRDMAEHQILIQRMERLEPTLESLFLEVTA